MDTEFHFVREQAAVLKRRLLKPSRLLQIVSGPRQSGKTTMVLQALKDIDVPWSYLLAEYQNIPQSSEISHLLRDDIPSGPEDIHWIVRNWEHARKEAKHSDSGSILVFDEIQKIKNWSEIVKGLWDYDRIYNHRVQVVLLGSAPLYIDKGKSDSLMGRFQPINSPYWSYPEMSEAFGFNLDQYIFYGGFPGVVPLIRELDEWEEYIDHAIIHPIMNRDIFALRRIDNPELFQRILERSVQYSGQLLSHENLAGQYYNAQNVTTVANYLNLLSRVGLTSSLPNYASSPIVSDRKVPKLNVLNTGLMSAWSELSFEEAKSDGSFWGRLVESAVGAHLLNTSSSRVKVYYWREKNREVDFVLKRGPKLVPVEVKSGRSQKKSTRTGLDLFNEKFNATGSILVGRDGVPVGDFLSKSARDWVEYSEYQ